MSSLWQVVGPPLLYVAVALFCVRLGARLVGRRGRPAAWATAILICVPLVLTGPALLTGRVYGPLDMALGVEPLTATPAAEGHEIRNLASFDLAFQIVPWHAAVRAAWQHGQAPLWNPFMMGGDALLGTAQAAPFHPFNLAALALPLAPSLGFLASITLFFGALGAFLWCRALGCREPSSLIAGAAWTLGGFSTAWLLWPMGLAAAHLPWTFLAVRQLVGSRETKRNVALLSAVLGSLSLAGHPETTAHAVALGGLYGLFELGAFKGPWKARLWPVGWAVVAGTLALGLSAVAMLPIVDALPQTGQWEGRQGDFVSDEHSVPLRQAVGRARTAFVPFTYGLPWAEFDPGPSYFFPISSAYVGSAILGLAVLGFLFHPWRGRFFFLILTGFGIAAGASMPGLTEALSSLPLLGIAIHKRLVMVGVLGLATAAALGAEWTLSSPMDGKRKWAWHLSHGAVGLLLVGLLALSLGRFKDSGFSGSFVVYNSFWLVAPWLAAWGAGLALTGLTLTGRHLRRLPLLWLLLLVAQRGAEIGDRYPALDLEKVYPPVAVLEPARVSGDGRFVALGELLPANLGSIYGVEDVRGYQPMSLGTYSDLLGLWSKSKGDAYFHRVHDLEAPFLDRLGVRWALAPADESLPAGWTEHTVDGSYRLLENHQARPRGDVPEWLETGLNPDQIRHRLHKASAETVFLEEDAPRSRRRNGSGSVTTQRHGAELRLTVSVPSSTGVEPTFVTVNEPWWRGWRAAVVDGPLRGTELDLQRVDRTFFGFYLPPGRHEVRVFYRPLSFVIGVWMSGLSLLLWGALVFRIRRPSL